MRNPYGSHDHSEDSATSLAAFEEMAASAYERLPEVIRAPLNGLVIRVEDYADDDTLRAMDIGHPLELTGLYVGIPLQDKSVAFPGDHIDTVYLYREPILAEWRETGVSLEKLIEHVLIHEIGHHYGFSDEAMDAILGES